MNLKERSKNSSVIKVAGGKASFISGDRSIFEQALGTDAKSTAEYLYNNILPDDKNITFSFYIANNNAYMASGFISKGKLFGIINISCYIREQNKIFKIMNKELSEL